MRHGCARKIDDPAITSFLHHVVAIIFISTLILCGDSSAEQKDGKATVRKSKNNLNFQIPEDWPIEERGGLVAPIPAEEYLAMKFENLELRTRRGY